jgi:hypothetical protein
MRQGPAVVDSPKNSRQKANARPSDEKDTVRRHKYLCALCRDEPKISVVLQGICLCAFVRYNGSKKYLSDHFISLPPRDEDLARLRWRARRTAEQQAAEPKNRLKMPSTSPSEFIWSRILIPPASDTDDAPTGVLSECVMKKRSGGTQTGPRMRHHVSCPSIIRSCGFASFFLRQCCCKEVCKLQLHTTFFC